MSEHGWTKSRRGSAKLLTLRMLPLLRQRDVASEAKSGPSANALALANRTVSRTSPTLSSGKVMELSPDAIADRSR
jgi:hypothetical protein